MNVWLKRLLYVSGLFLIVGATMLITMPVQFMVIQWGLPESIRIGTVAGTLQSGRVSDFVYNQKLGQIDLKESPMDISWKWCPGWSQGVFSWCVGIESPLLKGKGSISYALLAEEYRLFDANFRLYVQSYPVDFKGMQSELKGVGSISLQELRFDSNSAFLEELIAEGEWEKLATPEFELGNYLWRANLGNSSILTSDFSGGSKDFKLRGQASVDFEKRAYRYKVDLMTEDTRLLAVLKSRATESRNNTLIFSSDGKF